LCQNVKVPFILLPPLNLDDPDPYPSLRAEASQAAATGTTSEQREVVEELGHEQEISSPRRNQEPLDSIQ